MDIDIEDFDSVWQGYLDSLTVFWVIGNWEATWVDGFDGKVVLRGRD